MKTFTILLCSLMLSLGAEITLVDHLPEPYCSICDLPFDDHGWFENQDSLAACLSEIPVKTVVEVGSWLGASTRFIADLVSEDAKVYAVDSWLGTLTPLERRNFESDPRLPYAYQLFLSNVKHANLTHKIVPIRMKSLEAAQALNIQADLIYIDAAHDQESVYQDIIAWYKHLTPEGIICGDDWKWWPTVRAGVTKAAKELHLEIVSQGNFWRMRPYKK